MNLFLKSKAKGLVLCKHVPFKLEEDLEDLVFENGEILGDIFPLWRQVRGGGKPGIPDVIGIDQEGSVCIVEIKNVTVDEGILPQVLAYAIWAENNLDSIAKMWLEKKDRPEGLSPNFDTYAVRIVVVAPSISPGTAHHMGKVTFAVDLLEVNRYQLEEGWVVAVHKVEAPKRIKPGPVAPAGSYDKLWYETNGFDQKTIDEYFGIIEQVEEIVDRNGWALNLKLNKGYASFKSGGLIAFGVAYSAREVFFKLTEAECKALAPANPGRYRYEAGFKQGDYRIESGKASVEDYLPLMEACAKRLLGN